MEEVPHTPLNHGKGLPIRTLLQTPLDPTWQLAHDSIGAKPFINQQDTSIVILMPDRPANALIDSPHASVLVEFPSGRLGFRALGGLRLAGCAFRE
jgi:hypothetical protein